MTSLLSFSKLITNNFYFVLYLEPPAVHVHTHQSPSDGLAVPHHNSSRVGADPFASHSKLISTSVPSQSYMQEHFSHHPITEDDYNFEGVGHGRSRSVDLRKSKSNSNTPSSKRKLLKTSPQELQDSNRSLTSVQEDNTTTSPVATGSRYSNSRRNSLCSADSDSGAGSKSDSASMSRKHNKRADTVPKGCSSGESSKYSQSKMTGAAKKSKEGSKLSSKLSRVFSWSDLRLNSSPKLNGRRTSDKGKDTNPSSGAGSRRSSGQGSSGSGENNCSQRKLLEHMKPPHSSSDGGGGGEREKRALSPVVIYRDDDPSYIHNSLQLFLVMDVFSSTKEESFKMVFRSSMVRYGEPGELPMLVVVSNIRAYLFRVVAPERYL